MLLLAFETSAKTASVALFQEDTLIGEQYQNTGLTHSQTLMVMAQSLISQCGFAPGDVEAVAVANGPGSFTGVRIGVAAAKGFAWAKQLPLYGVSTLEAMATGLGISHGYICAVMDARRNQVYNGIYYGNRGKIEQIAPDRAISLDDLKTELKNYEEPIYLVGDGSVLCYHALSEEIQNLQLPPSHRMHQRAVGVGLVAYKQIAQGQPGNGEALTPNYLRLSQAERERLEREQKE